jgi:hypothetical protein
MRGLGDSAYDSSYLRFELRCQLFALHLAGNTLLTLYLGVALQLLLCEARTFSFQFRLAGCRRVTPALHREAHADDIASEDSDFAVPIYLDGIVAPVSFNTLYECPQPAQCTGDASGQEQARYQPGQ